ncbi:MAG TPA: S8 family serine peptidase [Candidatus Methylomirabilis sp.]
MDNLWLLTTHWRPIEKLLTVSGETSAAAALAARMAAIPQAAYPNYWPETIRALLVQDALQPYDRSSIAQTTRYTMRDMHLHEIPWPAEVLWDLGETPVKMRVTLSYFVEPNPGRRGWKYRLIRRLRCVRGRRPGPHPG